MDITKSIVKITIEYKDNDNNIQIDHSTGFIVSSNDEDKDFIITVSHAFENFQNNEQVHFVSLANTEYIFQIREINYLKKGEYCSDEDIAIIIVDKVKWHAKVDNFYFPNKNENSLDRQVKIAGFPVRIEDRHLNMSYLPINGQITSSVNSVYTIKVSNINEAGITLFDSVQGLSGAPVYSIDNDIAFIWGIQKDLPHKEYSYNIINAISISKCIEVINKKYHLEIPLEAYDRELYKFKTCFLMDSINCGTYYLKELNSSLFPSIKENLGVRFYDSINENVSLITYLEETWNSTKDLNKGLIIIGDGGCGKTVTLLETCKFFLDRNVYSIYIPLYILKEKGYESIDNYLLAKFWLGNIEAYNNFKIWLSLGNEKKLVLALDGFNEVKNQYKRDIINDILNWQEISSVRIIISSRYDFTKSYIALKNMKCLEVQPLNNNQIQAYLGSCGIRLQYSNNENLISVLKTPLMLVLYTNIEIYHIPLEEDIPILKWRENCQNAGTILWNFIQCQYKKILLQNKEGVDLIYTVFTLEYICPYIARYMEKDYIYSLKEEVFANLIDKAIIYYEERWEGKISSKIKRIEREYELEINKWDSKKIYSILTKELHLFIVLNENVTLLHQQFRDFFSAFFYTLILEDKEAIEYWDKDSINYNVLNYIAEIIETTALVSIWEEIRGRAFTTKNYGLSNIIQIIKKINHNNENDDLSQIKFDKIDLRFISLNGTQLTSKKGKASFRGAKIGKYTLFPKGHSDSIYCISITPDGNKAITGSSDRTVREWNLRTGECEKILAGHTVYVQSVDYSFDAKLAISGDFFGGIILWNLENSSVVRQLQGGENCKKAVYGIKFFSDRMVVSVSYDGEIKVWDINQGKCIRKVEVSRGGVRCLDVYSIKGKVVVGSYDGTISEWNINNGKLISKVNLNNGPVRTVMYSKYGERILAGCESGVICEYDVTKNEVTHIINAHEQKISKVAFSFDESKIVSCSYDKKIKVWNLEQEEMICEIATQQSRYCASFLPNKDFIIEAGSDAGFELWNYVTCERYLKVEGAQYSYNVTRCVFGREHFAVLDKDNLCRLRNYDGYNQYTMRIKVTNSHFRDNQILDINEMEDSILCCIDGLVQEINLKSGVRITYIESFYCEKGCFAFDKKLLLIKENDNQKNLLIYDNVNEELKSINIPSIIEDVIYSDINNMAVAYSKYKIFGISNTGKWECLYKGKSVIKHVQFLEDEHKIIIWLKNNNVLKIDIRSKKVVYRYKFDIYDKSIINFSGYGDKAIFIMNDCIYEVEFKKNKIIALDIKSTGISFIKYICNDKKCIVVDKFGKICIYDLAENAIYKVIEHIDGVDITDCDFSEANFEDTELRNLIQLSGGKV